jgi:hypothetical protein
MPPKKPRVSLTKAQIQAGVGAELLALCQTVTADGVLTNVEVAELRNWLEVNRSADLPAIEFLVATLERILADGKITAQERKDLYTAIEKILPPEARREATAQRKAVETEVKEQDRRERQAEKQQEREERERNRHVYSMNFMVAGVAYEGRDAVVRRCVAEGDTVYLVRDPGNRYSSNAIEVRLENGMQIGFVPEDYAPEAAPYLDAGYPHKAYVTKIIGYRYSIPVVQAYIHRPDADVEDLVLTAAVPAKRYPPREWERDREPEPVASDWEGLEDRPRKASGKGCLVLLPLVCAPAAILATRALELFG